MDFKPFIRIIENFPKEGIRFKDITTLLKDGAAYKQAIDEIAIYAQKLNVDVVAGPEARGFVIGAPLSYALGAGFAPVRKPGKLPSDTVSAEYDLEYGKDVLEIHRDAIQPGQRVLIADDLLATGGTISTTVNLVKQLGGEIVGAAFLIELTYLNGRDRIKDIDVFSLVKYS